MVIIESETKWKLGTCEGTFRGWTSPSCRNTRGTTKKHNQPWGIMKRESIKPIQWTYLHRNQNRGTTPSRYEDTRGDGQLPRLRETEAQNAHTICICTANKVVSTNQTQNPTQSQVTYNNKYNPLPIFPYKKPKFRFTKSSKRPPGHSWEISNTVRMPANTIR